MKLTQKLLRNCDRNLLGMTRMKRQRHAASNALCVLRVACEKTVAEDELICPMPKCGTQITVPQTQGATYDTPLWNKFLQFRMNIWVPKTGDGFIVTCPTVGCEKFVVDRHREEVECPHCSKRFCSKCGKDPHQGSSCAEHADSEADQRFEQMMVEQGWKPCPVCGMPTERDSGCNFMQCRSGTCRKRTYWCYICGLQMGKENHYKHYPQGPYDNDCNTPMEDRRVGGRAPRQTADSSSWGWVKFAVGAES